MPIWIGVEKGGGREREISKEGMKDAWNWNNAEQQIIYTNNKSNAAKRIRNGGELLTIVLANIPKYICNLLPYTHKLYIIIFRLNSNNVHSSHLK